MPSTSRMPGVPSGAPNSLSVESPAAVSTRTAPTSVSVPPAVCSATYPHTTFVCGQAYGEATNPCIGSNATCSSLPDYECSCTGSLAGTASCSYCQVKSFDGIMCIVTNAQTTFIDLNLHEKTCSCMYTGNGNVNLTCFTPTLSPTAHPTSPTLPPASPTPPILSTFRMPGVPTGAPIALSVESPVPVPPPRQPRIQQRCRCFRCGLETTPYHNGKCGGMGTATRHYQRRAKARRKNLDTRIDQK
jgi:hypothetical protein